MSRVYDNWERLVEATLKRELLRELALCPSFESSISDDFSSRFSFDCLDFNEHPVEEMVFSELKEKTDNFGLNALIGDGYYGRVYLAQLNNGDVAAQRLDVSYKSDHEFFTQVSMVSSLKHENIVELIGYCVEGNIRILAYEFATMGSLYDILHGRKGPVLDWMQRVRIALDIARGLAYLHEKVQLRNIRSSSVLLFNDYKAKVADFNFTNQAPGARILSTHVRETIACRAPEYAMTRQLTEKANIYSFGVVLLELFTGRNSIESGQKNLVSWATPRLSEDNFKQCIDPKLMEVYPPKAAAKLAAIAALCVQYEPEFRIDISRVVKTLELVLKESQAFVSAPAPAVI